MKHICGKAAALLTAGLLTLSTVLTGCISTGAENLYSLPEASERYQNLQKALTVVTDSGYAYLPPTTGTHQEPAELIDLDGDGCEEAVAFFSGSDSSVIACVFAETDGAYQEVGRLHCAGTGIVSADYCDLDGDGCLELLVSCSVGESAPQVLQVYSPMKRCSVAEVLCSRYILQDLNGDGFQDLICLNEGGTCAEAVLWTLQDGGLAAAGTLKLSGMLTELTLLEAGCLSDSKPALLTGFAAAGGTAMDVLVVSGGAFSTVKIDGAPLQLALPGDLQLKPDDRNQDGITEFPMLRRLHACEEDEGENEQYVICWDQLESSGTLLPAETVYYSTSGGWYLTVPGCWAEDACVRESSAMDSGCILYSTTFYRTGRGSLSDEEQLTVYSIVGENALQAAESQGLTVLYSETGTVTAVRLNESAAEWDGSISLSLVSEGLKLTGSNA